MLSMGLAEQGQTQCLAPSGRLVILLLYGSSHHNKSQSALGRTASPATLKAGGRAGGWSCLWLFSTSDHLGLCFCEL